MPFVRSHFAALALLAIAVPSVLLSQGSSDATRPNGEMHSPAELDRDLSALQMILESSHASLYSYTSPAALRRVFQRARNAASRPMSDAELYRLVTGLLSEIRDGHTQAVGPAALMKQARGAAPRFPLSLDFASGHAYVTASTTDSVPLGCDLQSINGRSISSVRDSILAHLPGDGDIVTGKLRALSRNFPTYYYLFVESPSTFTVTCRNPGKSTVVRTVVTALTSAEFSARAHKIPVIPDLTGPDAAVHLASLPLPHAARLVLGTFAYDANGPSNPPYATLLDSAFARIQRDSIIDLVIDIRGNDGGADYGPDIFLRFARAPFRFVDSITARTRDLSTLLPFTKVDSSFTRRLAQRLVPAGKGAYRVAPTDSEFAVITPKPNSYRGCVWTLIDGDTFSAASEFASIARRTNRGPFVGEETGGAYHGNSAGEFVVVTLPATKIRVVIPLERYVLASSDNRDRRRGIRPDIRAVPNRDALLGGEDVALDSAVRAIEQSRAASGRRARKCGGQ